MRVSVVGDIGWWWRYQLIDAECPRIFSNDIENIFQCHLHGFRLDIINSMTRYCNILHINLRWHDNAQQRLHTNQNASHDLTAVTRDIDVRILGHIMKHARGKVVPVSHPDTHGYMMAAWWRWFCGIVSARCAQKYWTGGNAQDTKEMLDFVVCTEQHLNWKLEVDEEMSGKTWHNYSLCSWGTGYSHFID